MHLAHNYVIVMDGTFTKTILQDILPRLKQVDTLAKYSPLIPVLIQFMMCKMSIVWRVQSLGMGFYLDDGYKICVYLTPSQASF